MDNRGVVVDTSYTKPSSGIRLVPAAFLIWSVSAISGLVAYLVAFWPSKSSPKVTSPPGRASTLSRLPRGSETFVLGDGSEAIVPVYLPAAPR